MLMDNQTENCGLMNCFYININYYANIQRNLFSKFYCTRASIQELKFNTKNLNELAQQEALIKYKRNVSSLLFRLNFFQKYLPLTSRKDKS